MSWRRWPGFAGAPAGTRIYGRSLLLGPTTVHKAFARPVRDAASPIGPGARSSRRIAVAGRPQSPEHRSTGEHGRPAPTSAAAAAAAATARRVTAPPQCQLADGCPFSLQEFLGRALPSSVTIVEVGPRDGLQNEKDKVRQPLGSSAAT